MNVRSFWKVYSCCFDHFRSSQIFMWVLLEMSWQYSAGAQLWAKEAKGWGRIWREVHYICPQPDHPHWLGQRAWYVSCWTTVLLFAPPCRVSRQNDMVLGPRWCMTAITVLPTGQVTHLQSYLHWSVDGAGNMATISSLGLRGFSVCIGNMNTTCRKTQMWSIQLFVSIRELPYKLFKVATYLQIFFTLPVCSKLFINIYWMTEYINIQMDVLQ